MLDLLQMELQAAVTSLWVLGTQAAVSARAAAPLSPSQFSLSSSALCFDSGSLTDHRNSLIRLGRPASELQNGITSL